MKDGEEIEQTRLFDTAESEKICGIKNGFNYEVKEIYITGKGIIFTYDKNTKKIEIPNQKEIKKYIGEYEPDKYIKYFGEVEGA